MRKESQKVGYAVHTQKTSAVVPSQSGKMPETCRSDGIGMQRPAYPTFLLDYSFLYDANIPAAEKKILWQKMKKLRSAG
jgi:Trm5-related predicted tRNA methylase